MNIPVQALKDAKSIEYHGYINEHRENVVKAYYTLRNIETILLSGIKEISIDVLDKLFRRVLHHDKSKYSDEEFEAYRKYFYPINDVEKRESKDDFDLAWKHHYLNNDHHWEHYVINDDIGEDSDDNYNPIPIDALLELVCDWMAMGIKFNNTAIEYYNKNKETIYFNKETRELLERILKLIYSHID